jgi:type IV pilus assembly protein PilA
MVHKQKGFSLIELLIVVAIILIIAAIAIPNLIRARIAANEAATAATVRTVATGDIQFQATYPTTGYSPGIANMGPTSSAGCTTPTSAAACLIDIAIVNATSTSSPKNGYVYQGLGTMVGFSVGGTPLAVGKTGNRAFCAINDAVLRVDSTGATAGSACQFSLPALAN